MFLPKFICQLSQVSLYVYWNLFPWQLEWKISYFYKACFVIIVLVIASIFHKSIVTDITMHNSHIKDKQIKEWNYIYLATPSKSLSRPSTTVGPAVTPSFSKTGDSVGEIPIEIQIEFKASFHKWNFTISAHCRLLSDYLAIIIGLGCL